MKTPLDWLQNTRRYSFSNGLTLLTHPLPNSEAAGLHFCVKAGYFCETDSEVGLAHLLEHMYFKGSARYPEPGTIGIRMKALGGMINATTSYDQTNYFCEVPADNLIPALAIMADAFLTPLFPEEELRKECEVVIEEFNRKIDSPGAYSQEKLIQLAYTTHRMRRWRIGTPEQLRSYSRDHLFDYFRRYYQPQNMIVTVTGKFNEDIVTSIEKLFASMPRSELRKDFGPSEPPQKELRYENHRAVATQSYLHFAFHAPGVLAPESDELDFLASLLSSGRSARLHRYVVEKQRSASSVSCSYLSFEDIGLFTISAVTEPDKVRQAAKDIWAVVTDLQQHGIADDELRKVKNKMELHQVMQTEDALNLAQLLSYYEAYGGYEGIERYLQRMAEMDEERILAAGKKHLRLSTMSVLEFVNQQLPAWSTRDYSTHVESGFTPPEMVLPPPLVLEKPKDLGEAQPGVAPPKIVQQGDVTFILHADRHVPFIGAGIFFQGGRNEEMDSNAGITHLLFRTILKGTSRLSAEQLSFRFDALGNPPRFHCSRDYTGFSFETLPESFPQMWELLLECVEDCRFPLQEVETERGKMFSMIRRNMDDNFVRPLQLFQRAFYGAHPYSIPESGFDESLSAITLQDLHAWKQRLFRRDRAVVVVVGNFDQQMMSDLLASTLHLNEEPSNGNAPSFQSSAVSRSLIETREKKQTAFVLGFPAVTARDPEIYKYEVMQQVLAGMGGRLFLNLRSKRSLAYTVFASCAAGMHAGTFVTYIAGEASKEEPAYRGMWEELEKLKESLVSEHELQNGKNGLIGGYSLSTQTAHARVLDYLSSHISGRPIPFVQDYKRLVTSVTAEDILEVARKTFDPAKSALGIVRGVAGIRTAEETAGTS